VEACHGLLYHLEIGFGLKLQGNFQIKCVPTLIFMDLDGKFITNDGSCVVSIHGAKAYPFTDIRLVSLQREMDEVEENYSGGWIGC